MMTSGCNKFTHQVTNVQQKKGWLDAEAAVWDFWEAEDEVEYESEGKKFVVMWVQRETHS